MKLTIKLFGFPKLNEIFGSTKIDIEFEGKTAMDLISELVKTHGSAVEKIIMDENGRFSSSVRLLKNGCQWLTLEDLDTKLSDGDRIVLALLVAGG